ncbi:MAG: extracellular solute-binding protein [Pseudomonadota bacterium]
MTQRLVFCATAVTILSLSTAAAKPITVYAPWPEEEADWVQEQAVAAGHEVEFVTGGGGQLFDRILAEREKPQADVALGFVDTALAAMKREGLLLAYTPVWADELPVSFRDDEDQMVYKFWQTPIVIAYNADELETDDVPLGWLDLVKPEYAGRYVIGSMNSQSTRAYLAGILSRFTDDSGEVTQDGWDFMRAFFDNGIVAEDFDTKTEALRTRDAVIDLNWLGGAQKYGRDLGYNVAFVDAEGGTPVIADGLAILVGTDQVEQSQAFVDWFGGAEFLAAHAHAFSRIPNLPGALSLVPDDVKANAFSVSPQNLNWDDIGPKLDGWLHIIESEYR